MSGGATDGTDSSLQFTRRITLAGTATGVGTLATRHVTVTDLTPDETERGPADDTPVARWCVG